MSEPSSAASSSGADADSPGAGGKAWYEESFGADYLARYAHRDEAEAAAAVDMLARHVPLRERDVLDLACGAGRHIPPLLAHGARRVAGLDLSADLLAAAQTDLAPEVAQGRVELVRGDMRQVPLPNAAVDVVVSFFTSFGYFDTTEDDQRVLHEIARVLRESGRFALDFFNAPVAIAGLVREDALQAGGETLRVRRWYDEAHGRLEKRVETADGQTRLRESVRAYRADELTRLAATAGLQRVHALGDYDGTAFDEAHSPRFIGIFEKRAD